MADWRDAMQGGAILPIDIPSILIVESDPEIAMVLQQALKSELHLSTLFAATVKDATKVTRLLKPILFLIDEHLSDGDGMTLYDQLHQLAGFELIPALILSSRPHLCQPWAKEQQVHCLAIPFELDDLLVVLEGLLSLPRMSDGKQHIS